jgi:hypothetical protein
MPLLLVLGLYTFAALLRPPALLPLMSPLGSMGDECAAAFRSSDSARLCPMLPGSETYAPKCLLFVCGFVRMSERRKDACRFGESPG